MGLRLLLLIALLAMLLPSHPPPSRATAQAAEARTVRVTFYTDYGVMRSGITTYYGAASCGYHWSLGTLLMTSDGRVWQCLDRGAFAPDGLDIYEPSYWAGYWDIEATLGLWDTVTVIRYGDLPN